MVRISIALLYGRYPIHQELCLFGPGGSKGKGLFVDWTVAKGGKQLVRIVEMILGF